MTIKGRKHGALETNQTETETNIVMQEGEEKNETQKTKATNPQTKTAAEKTQQSTREMKKEIRKTE